MAGPSTSTMTSTNSINYVTSNLPNTQQWSGSEKFSQHGYQEMISTMANFFNNSSTRSVNPFSSKGKENSVAINENNCSEPGKPSSTNLVGKKSICCCNT